MFEHAILVITSLIARELANVKPEFDLIRGVAKAFRRSFEDRIAYYGLRSTVRPGNDDGVRPSQTR